MWIGEAGVRSVHAARAALFECRVVAGVARPRDQLLDVVVDLPLLEPGGGLVVESDDHRVGDPGGFDPVHEELQHVEDVLVAHGGDHLAVDGDAADGRTESLEA